MRLQTLVSRILSDSTVLSYSEYVKIITTTIIWYVKAAGALSRLNRRMSFGCEKPLLTMDLAYILIRLSFLACAQSVKKHKILMHCRLCRDLSIDAQYKTFENTAIPPFSFLQ
jgi:hypothetical protein